MGYHGAGEPNGGVPVSGFCSGTYLQGAEGLRRLRRLLTSAAGRYPFGIAEGYEVAASLQGCDEKVSR